MVLASGHKLGEDACKLPLEPSSQSRSMPLPRTASSTHGSWSETVQDVGRDLASYLEATEDQSPILSLIADSLQQSVERCKLHAGGVVRMPDDAGPLTVFHGNSAPPISIHAYVERLAKYSRCSPACFVMAFAYMDSLAQRDSCLQPCHLNVHRLLLAGVMVAAKFTDDGFFNNAFYAKVGGVSTSEINRLELELLKLLDFKVSVKPELLWLYTKQLRAGLAHIDATSGLQQGRKRRSHSGLNVSGEDRAWQRKSQPCLPKPVTEAAPACECKA